MEPDFSGWASKAGLKCKDGRTIMRDAFKHQDQVKVPLVWQHGHSDPTNVLGYAILEHRDEGVYTKAFFNDTEKGKHAKSMVKHGDINRLSIWANELVERSKRVLSGSIKEVSLVLSGANPGACIENVNIAHGDDDFYELEDEAIIHTGLTFDNPNLEHAEDDEDSDDTEDDSDDEETIEDVYNSMTPKQQEVLHYMVGEALETSPEDLEEDDDQSDDEDEDNASHSDLGENNMGTKRHNVFEDTGSSDGAGVTTLSHSDIAGIFAAAQKGGSLSSAVEDYALAHGIENIGTLFPEATNLTNSPEFFARRMEWVNTVLNGARKSPFSRVRTLWADITMEEARAKGYIKGNMKKEEFFSVARRATTPTTIYKKQKLDRDDILDISDFDVVVWLRAEMRVMLDEELARAILVGDGRDPSSDDKINEGNIRPIASDHELYTTKLYVNLDDSNSTIQEVTDAIVANRSLYRGSGLPTFFTTESIASKYLLLKDSLGRRIYKSLSEVADELRVKEIVPVEVLEEYEDIVGIIVNMADYNIGADKGGEVNMFDDFDIDYNQYKYLLETRVSGALIKLKAALVILRTAGADVMVVPDKPTFDASSGELTVPATNSTKVTYKDITNPNSPTTITNGSSPYTVSEGASMIVEVTPNSGYYFAVGDRIEWTFKRPADD